MGAMPIRHIAILMLVAASLIGCDRLVLRRDTTELPGPILTEAQATELGSKVHKSVSELGYREVGGCSRTAVIYCASFESPTRAQLIVSVPNDNPSRIEADFSSFGNLIDQSADAFSAVRKAVR